MATASRSATRWSRFAANAHGKYAHPDDLQDKPSRPDSGFGRVPTDDKGSFKFTTIKPAAAAPAGGLQAPHINVTIFMRGLLAAPYASTFPRSCQRGRRGLQSVPPPGAGR